MNLYKWVLRIAFVLFLGGSIFGILKIQDYVDDRVAKRVEKQDTLYSASAYNAGNNYRYALENLELFITSSNKTGSQKDDGLLVTSELLEQMGRFAKL